MLPAKMRKRSIALMAFVALVVFTAGRMSVQISHESPCQGDGEELMKPSPDHEHADTPLPLVEQPPAVPLPSDAGRLKQVWNA